MCTVGYTVASWKVDYNLFCWNASIYTNYVCSHSLCCCNLLQHVTFLYRFHVTNRHTAMMISWFRIVIAATTAYLTIQALREREERATKAILVHYNVTQKTPFEEPVLVARRKEAFFSCQFSSGRERKKNRLFFFERILPRVPHPSCYLLCAVQ